jgi:intracellular sulfur oxidation DsrE/DsrF family protein
MTLNKLNTKLLIPFFLFLLLPFSVFADADKDKITKILTLNETPDGVVFELLGSEDNEYLPNALKKVEAFKKQLQAKFPKLDIAVVSHGAEQFELTTDNKKDAKESHKLVQRLVAADIPVHICETHASWRGVVAEDFPDYITPSPQGPAQIKQYQELGYILVLID